MNKILYLIYLLTFFAWNISIGQVVVDLDKITNKTSYGTSYTSPDGMVFSINGDGVSEFIGLDYIGHNDGKGIDIVIVSDAVTTLTIQREDGNYFTFNSIYLRDGFGDADISVQGFNGTIQTNITDISMFMLDDLYTFDWVEVNRVTISSSDLSLAFDKITYTATYPQFEDDLTDGTDVVSIDENSSLSTKVYDVNANDGLGGTTDNNLIYSIASGNINLDRDAISAFEIDESTGEVVVSDPDDLDRETTKSISLKIQADNGSNAANATLTINLNDINDIAPEVKANQTFNIPEQSSNSTSVGFVEAKDGDVSPTTFQDWTISAGNTNNAFAIDSQTGEISVANSSILDRESITSFALSITLSDGINTSAPETVEVMLSDINDEIPEITENQTFSIEENATNGTSVGTVSAMDADISNTTFQAWTITEGNTDGAFSINTNSGEIIVANQDALDREIISVFTLSITVSDGFNTSTPESVTIELIDVNETAPVITSGLTFTANEGLPEDAVVGVVTATDTDDDATLQNWIIISGNNNDVFTLNSTSGEITISGNGDLTSQTSYVLELTVSDGLFISDTETVKIIVNLKPVFTQENYNVNINEDVAIGTTLIVVEATDPESTSISYKISSGNQNNLFEINTNTGEIITNDILDAEVNPTYTLEIKATDEDGVSEMSVVNVTVNPVEITGIEEYFDNEIEIYPNPSTGIFTIDMPAQNTFTVRLFDLKTNLVAELGELVMKKEIDISSYREGVYYLSISDQDQRLYKKIIITK